ncbi:MAG: hypothetical protein GX605_12055 [Chloroflexi bacterium]|nr:hypothetical protein [Chloroflexota bacterium]
MNSRTTPSAQRTLWACALFLLASLCCGSLLVGGAFWWLQSQGAASPQPPALPSETASPTRVPTGTATPLALRPSATPTAALLATPTATQAPTATETPTTLEALRNAELPHRDLAELASRLRYGGMPISAVAAAEPHPYEVGDVDTFWIANTDTREHVQIRAVLRYQTDHAQMWVEEGAKVDLDELRRSAERFEQHTYPIGRDYFGSEWTPGVDGDPQLVILHAHNLGGVGGYFSAADEYSRLANPFSNQREMFYISLDYRRPGNEEYDSTLAHEFQHMIHWYQDRNESAWVNEGLSMLAQQVCGLPVGNLYLSYLRQPDMQLTTWGDEENGPRYGATYLLMAYFLERYGAPAVRLLVEAEGDGELGFDQTLPLVGGETFNALFADWVAANLLDDPTFADGRYGYRTLDFATPTTERLRADRGTPYSGSVRQYGVDYLEFSADDLGTLRFVGSAEAPLAPVGAASGRYAWWSNRGDDVNTRLTRAFDLSGLSQATLEVQLWYDLERDYDYAYISASADGGRSWTLLQGRHTTDSNPTGNNLGHGYNGLSGGAEPVWILEQVDLSAFAGGEVLLRFEVVTDDAVNHPGLLVDELRIPELGYYEDVETGEGGWQAEGFVRSDNVLPQGWLLQAVLQGSRETQVMPIAVDGQGRASWAPEDLPSGVRRVVLAVSAVAPTTTERADYQLWLEPDSLARRWE